MEARRAAGMLIRRDTAVGNWTAAPSPDPNTAPSTHPLNPVQRGPPYGTTTAVVGGVPTIATDVPISAVLLALFLASAAAHMTILQLNKRRGLKFLFSGMLFALCVLRSAALSMRMAWAAHPYTANVAIAAGILTQTGSVLVFVINLILTSRLVRGWQPALGWHPATRLAARLLIAGVVASLLMVIAVTVQSFFTLDTGIRAADRTVQLVAGMYMAVLAFLPLPILLLAGRVLPRTQRIEKFGAGRWRSKVRLLIFTSALATVGATFRVATGFAPRPLSSPAWYHSRACYYCFNYVTDLLISAAFLLSRFDKRFIVPNGAKGPGDYAKGVRVRSPSSAVSSRGDDDDDDEEGNETDPEKLAQLRGDNSNEGGSEKTSLPMYDDKSKGKGKGKAREDKGKNVDIDGDEKLPVSCDAGTQTYGPGGDWNGVPWPFRTSWAMQRNYGGAVPSSPHTNRSSAGEGTDTEVPLNPASPVDSPFHLFGCIDEVSSQWGGETSSTYIQEPEPVHLRTQRQRPSPKQSHNFGQALTSDEEIHLDSPGLASDTIIWPFTSETLSSGRDPITRSNSAATYSYSRASCSRTPSKHHISRSRSSRTVGHQSMEGGWI